MSIADRGARLLGGTLLSWTTLAGGDLAEVAAIELADGREAVVKGGPDPLAEAEMLEVLARAGVPVPRVLACDRELVVLERVRSDGTIEQAWHDLGLVLARLHGARGSVYGWHRDYAFAELKIPNAWADDWSCFWGERRLLGQTSRLPGGLRHRLEQLVRDLPNRLPARPDPVLLHGDLWTGNVLVSGDRISALIDPACYYGHREGDFAMLRLFARPPPSLFAAAGGLDSSEAERRPIYQLWPALVHLRLFGSGYLSLVARLLAAAGV